MPAPSSFKVPALTRAPLAVLLVHARAFNKRPCGRLQEWGQVQLAPAARAGWKPLGSFSFLSVNFVSDRTFRSLCLSSIVIHMQRIALAWCFPVNDERGIP